MIKIILIIYETSLTKLLYIFSNYKIEVINNKHAS